MPPRRKIIAIGRSWAKIDEDRSGFWRKEPKGAHPAAGPALRTWCRKVPVLASLRLLPEPSAVVVKKSRRRTEGRLSLAAVVLRGGYSAAWIESTKPVE